MRKLIIERTEILGLTVKLLNTLQHPAPYQVLWYQSKKNGVWHSLSSPLSHNNYNGCEWLEKKKKKKEKQEMSTIIEIPIPMSAFSKSDLICQPFIELRWKFLLLALTKFQMHYKWNKHCQCSKNTGLFQRSFLGINCPWSFQNKSLWLHQA